MQTTETTVALPETMFAPMGVPQGAENRGGLTPIHWWYDCGKADAVCERAVNLAPLAAAYRQGGAAAVLKAASGNRGKLYVSRAWCLAYTAVWGPTWADESESPRVLQIKAQALGHLKDFLSVC